MSKNTDTDILELMTSKICHDLISPVGAISNGIEILEEMDGEPGEEVTGLLAFSAAQASARLQAFRLAYGAGGADSNLKPEDIHKAFETLVGIDAKITQEWDPYAPIGNETRPAGFCKMLACGLLLALDALPKGGTISVTEGPDGDTLIRAEGANARLKDNTLAALSLTIDSQDLDPKTIHFYTTGLIARKYGFRLSEYEKHDGLFIFSLSAA